MGEFSKTAQEDVNMAPFSTIPTQITFNTAWLSFQEFFFHFAT